ncbi:hypothetical protein K227x_33670 [Rubripirellula lacrimiformis]|uniref:Uncharacterized protein n=1 Tax=Rubripirellula lacrimiformis TaxID=1930273 RepID=A0A517NCV2_9BACT|nr:hypothetical protein K227x_33670 [Rubripirellula lacrimiformis]
MSAQHHPPRNRWRIEDLRLRRSPRKTALDPPNAKKSLRKMRRQFTNRKARLHMGCATLVHGIRCDVIEVSDHNQLPRLRNRCTVGGRSHGLCVDATPTSRSCDRVGIRRQSIIASPVRRPNGFDSIPGNVDRISLDRWFRATTERIRFRFTFAATATAFASGLDCAASTAGIRRLILAASAGLRPFGTRPLRSGQHHRLNRNYGDQTKVDSDSDSRDVDQRNLPMWIPRVGILTIAGICPKCSRGKRPVMRSLPCRSAQSVPAGRQPASGALSKSQPICGHPIR